MVAKLSMHEMRHSSGRHVQGYVEQPPSAGPPWGALAVYNLFRMGLGGLTLGLWLSSALGSSTPAPDFGFPWLGSAAFGSGCLAILTIHRRLIGFVTQAHALLLLDWLLITVAIVRHGLGHDVHILFMAPVFVAALLLQRRSALLMAALATLATLFAQGFHEWCCATKPNTMATGIFGLITFAGALGGSVLKKHLDRITAQAMEREQDLSRLHHIIHTVVQVIQEGLIVLDDKGVIRFINPEAKRLIGGGGEGMALQALAPALFERPLHDQAVSMPSGCEVVAQSISHVGELETLRLLVLEDVHRLGPRLEAIKLKAMARLAGGIAHEIRNPLMTLRQAAALLAEDISDQQAQHVTLVDMIDRQAERINAIIEAILGLSRMQPGMTAVVLLRDFLPDFIQRHEQQAAPIRLDCDPELPPVLFDPNHLEQVLGNLVRNAYQHAGGGEDALQIRITVTRAQDSCIIDVLDNGPGLRGQSLTEIFEPFYSTGGGAGLGLYLARELCVYHGAELRVCEAEGGWFRMRLRWALPRE